MKYERNGGPLSRRQVISVGVTIGGIGLAGCLGSGTTINEDRATSRPRLGDGGAPVTVEVFEDFACPHCRRFNREVARQLETEYVSSGETQYLHYDLPVPVDEQVSWEAPSAARSVLGQTDHETFFEYADLLFENQGDLGPEMYAELADEVGADGRTARTAATEGRYRDTVEADREEARERGVGGTPAVYVNGDLVTDRLTYAEVSQEVAERL